MLFLKLPGILPWSYVIAQLNNLIKGNFRSTVTQSIKMSHFNFLLTYSFLCFNLFAEKKPTRGRLKVQANCINLSESRESQLVQTTALGSVHPTILPAEMQYHNAHYSPDQDELQLTRQPQCWVYYRNSTSLSSSRSCDHTEKHWLQKENPIYTHC